MPDGQKHTQPFGKEKTNVKNTLRKIIPQGQSVKKVEVQEALPPAGVIGAAPLTLVPQHFSRKPA